MAQESRLEQMVKSGPLRRLKREIHQFAHRWFILGWLSGLIYGYLVWSRGWPVPWTLLGFAVLSIFCHAVMDFMSGEKVKEWLKEEGTNLTR